MKIRLQRFMADCGVASRRECEGMVAAGRVRVNGEVRSELPVFVEPEKDVVTVDGEELAGAGVEEGVGLKEESKVYYLLNKPKGILVTNFDPGDRKTVGELMVGVKERVFPVGRLDMDSRGALIMTNDGELANRLTHPRYGVEKTYIVEVDGKVGPVEVEKMKRGMWLGPEGRGANGGIKVERFRVKILGRERGRTILEVRISEGKNREIRRVMARLGHTVRDLNRVAIAGKVTLQGVAVGDYRPLSEEEVKWLYRSSSNEQHERERAATQAWYEAKEREKERRRLEREKPGRPAPAAPRKYSPAGNATRPQGQRPGLRSRGPGVGRRGFGGAGPARGPQGGKQGRKPFVPRQVQRHTEAIRAEIRANHPLGGAARREDQE